MGEDLNLMRERAKSLDMRDWLGERTGSWIRTLREPEPGPVPIPYAGTVAGPIVGYRLWQPDARGWLWSLYQETRWPERVPLEMNGSVMQPTYVPFYDAYGVRCTATVTQHGIYAMKTAADLNPMECNGMGVGGRVALWGTVVEHERGYRAQFAYPIALWWATPVDLMPEWPKLPVSPTRRRLARRIEARYGVPMLDGPGDAR